MTGRFLGTVLALLVITATLAYNTHCAWRVSMQELRNQQAQLNYEVLETCERDESCPAAAAADNAIRP
jgi:hypothetical protein